MNKTQYLISTDLDGTLLDHHSYDFTPAIHAIKKLQSLNIPIVLNTSKSLSEVNDIAHKINVNPRILVVENGSALVLPEPLTKNLDLKDKKITEHGLAIIEFGRDRIEVADFLYAIRQEKGWQFSGYMDWDIQQIMDLTGLTEKQAIQSSQKEYSEPFIWQDSEENLVELKKLAREANFHIVKGGRFYHLQGPCTKATPLAFLKQHVAQIFPNNNDMKVIALGDNHNDVAMLNFSDYPICIKSPVNDFPNLNTQQPTLYSDDYGPVGWCKQIELLLKKLMIA